MNWAARPTSIFSLFLQHCLHPISFRLETTIEYAFRVKKWCFGVFVDISAILSREKRLEFFIQVHCFFLHLQCFVRVSVSNFCNLIYCCSRDTTLGSILRFIAGPRRRQRGVQASAARIERDLYAAANHWYIHLTYPYIAMLYDRPTITDLIFFCPG